MRRGHVQLDTFLRRLRQRLAVSHNRDRGHTPGRLRDHVQLRARRDIERIARQLAIPTTSLTIERAAEYLGNPVLATVFSLDVPASSEHTRALLGWKPKHATLLEDLTTGDYFAPEASVRAEEVWLPHGGSRGHSQG